MAHPPSDAILDMTENRHEHAVVVENRAGAGTAIAAAFVAKSDPDGYTVLVNSSAHTISPLLQPNPTFDPGRDFSELCGRLGDEVDQAAW